MHTPGPWEFRQVNHEWGAIARVGYMPHATVSGQSNSDQPPTMGETDYANAHLIAAAPDLLHACRAAMAYLADPPSEFAANRQEAASIIMAAIRKAEGGAQ